MLLSGNGIPANSLTADDATGRIGGTLWNDLNGDGVRGSDEPTIANRTVFLDGNKNGLLDSGEASTVTNNAGEYLFDGLGAGEYSVRQIVPDNWTPSFELTSDATKFFLRNSNLTDSVVDETRGLVYLTSDRGMIERIRIDTGEILPPIMVGNRLVGADITPDDQFLYVADARVTGETGFVYKVNLDDGSHIALPFSADTYGAWDVAVANNDKALVTVARYADASVFEIDLATDTITPRENTFRFVDDGAAIARTPDGSRLFLRSWRESMEPITVYDAASDTFLDLGETYVYDAHDVSAVSPNGDLLAFPLRRDVNRMRGLTITTLESEVVENIADSGGQAAFSPDGRLLYTVLEDDLANPAIVAIDTETWVELYRFRVGETLEDHESFNRINQMELTADGRTLVLLTPTGVRLYDLTEATGAISVRIEAGETDSTIDLGSYDARLPEILVDDITVVEENSGSTTTELLVSLSRPFARPIELQYATVDDSATIADDDYLPSVGQLAFAPGETTHRISIVVNADETDEFNEQFLLNLYGDENVSQAIRQVVVTIQNDDSGQRGTIEGSAFHGSVIYIDANNNSQLDAAEHSTITDDQGAYRLNDVPVGQHFVRQASHPRLFPKSPSGFAGVGDQRIAVPLNASSISEIVFDSTRNQLLITTGDGNIERLDIGTFGLNSPIRTRGQLNGFDITSDEKFIYVADFVTSVVKGVVRKIDLDTGRSQLIDYFRDRTEDGPSEVAIGEDGRGLLTSFSRDHFSLFLDTTTDELSESNVTGFITRIVRSHDRQRLLLLESNSGGFIHVYDPASDSLSASVRTNGYLGEIPAAVNRDGSIIALGKNGLTLFDKRLDGLPPFVVDGTTHALTFDPVRDFLYRASETEITIYDTTTWEVVSTFPIGTTLSGQNQMTMSADGRLLFLATDAEILVFRIVRDAHRVDVTGETTISHVDFEAEEKSVAIFAVQDEFHEGNAGFDTLTYRVVRSGDTSVETVVDWSVSGDVNAADFGGSIPSGRIVFQPGDLEKEIQIDFAGDRLVEDDEKLRVTISATDAAISQSTAETVLLNDDEATISVESVRQSERDGPMIFVVSLDNPVDIPVTVNYSTISVSASETDFVVQADRIRIPAGSLSVNIPIEVIDDDVVESDEFFFFDLDTLTVDYRNVQFVGGERDLQVRGTIENDDGRDISVSASISQAIGTPGQSMTYRITVENKSGFSGGVIVGQRFGLSRPFTVDFEASTPGWMNGSRFGYPVDYSFEIGDMEAHETRELVFVVILYPEGTFSSGSTFHRNEIPNRVSLYDDGQSGEDADPSDNSVQVVMEFRNPLAGLASSLIDASLINGSYTEVVAGNFDDDDGADDLFFWNPVSGQNRVVYADGSFQTNTVDPTMLNGNDFPHVVAGDYDLGDGMDLFFWNPLTGRNRLIHFTRSNGGVEVAIQTNAIDTPAVNGNDFTQVVSGNFDSGGAEDLFFWNPYTGKNRLVHLDAAITGTNTRTSSIQSLVVPVSLINGNDFDELYAGQFEVGQSEELFFVHTRTGNNRTISFSVVVNSFTTEIDSVRTNRIDPLLINGGSLRTAVIGDFDYDGLDDLFAWDAVTGRNRLISSSSADPDHLDRVIDDVIESSRINGDFSMLLTRRFREGDYSFSDSLFFWNPNSGRNRLGYG